MTVRRIVANIETADPAGVAAFYRGILGLELLMDHGWIVTYGTQDRMPLQVSFASEGGSGTPVPGLSVEVDDLDAVYAAVLEGGYIVEYGPADEPWGVRRFFVRDPAGTLVNIVMHL
ncbi:glyoxalase [Shinella sp. SUS2]|jgi:catechol 2,3-dioxygenase-like lactoylglutathione lyase family enzyme|uniref:VOC family protein n=1 Tax=unclassified Shinella TaxID=2643062 RepID=UPI0003C56A30|nr:MULTISPECIES: VOC family protein [unclassified Shinella]MCA0339516.1 VOC family protein [Pseudomonadota bacterium]PZR45089.1 MAG: glyoxalase [Stutzerimonas stutzeri]EYR80510.1 hypothetical protein SHLA_11c000150 [Shinella sp. DD12]KNY17326.1 glyoxalase [Shinella sp. SUS2]KOC72454.1 glyoxalase [Shinella sp. GWS1]